VDILESGDFKSVKDTDPPIEVDESALNQLWDQLQIEVGNGTGVYWGPN
jgi:hypothetical protein